jgi:hypothetical protein
MSLAAAAGGAELNRKRQFMLIGSAMSFERVIE